MRTVPRPSLQSSTAVWLSPFSATRKIRPQESHLRDFNASRNAGFVAAVSDLALIILAATDGSLAHEGISPQRISESCRTGSFGCWRMTGTACVGATLYR